MQLIDGGLAPFRIGSVTVRLRLVGDRDVAAPDAVLVEDDRWLSLSAPVDILPDPNPLRTLTRAHDVEPRALGDVVPDGELWRCVIIDVDADTMCAPASVEQAMANAVLRARQHGVSCVATHPLGCDRGNLDVATCLKAIARALRAAGDGPALELQIIVTPAIVADARDALEAERTAP